VSFFLFPNGRRPKDCECDCDCDCMDACMDACNEEMKVPLVLLKVIFFYSNFDDDDGCAKNW